MKKLTKQILLLALALLLAGCHGSRMITQGQDGGQGDASVPPPFSLASDFPADIVIPDIEGMRSTAFVVSTTDPSGIVAIDLDANPLALSNDFASFALPTGSGIPARLLVASIDTAYLVTSIRLIAFDPRSGAIIDDVSLLDPAAIGMGHENSDGSAADDAVVPAFPAGIALAGDRLFVSSANYIRTNAPAVAAPGTVLVFAIAANGTLSRDGVIVTTDYNPTGLAVRNDSELVVVNSGVIDIIDAAGVPQTRGSIDIVDPETLQIIANIPIGTVGLSSHAPAVSFDSARAFIGSFAYGEVYEIDLLNRRLLRGEDDPIVVTGGSDYITDVVLSMDDATLFVASFEQSAVFPFDLTTLPYERGEGFVVGFPAGVSAENPSGENTGAGPMAVRPGSRGIDYEGADLFVLTGSPGQVVPVASDTPAQAILPTPPEEVEDAVDDGIAVPEPPEGDDGDPCQGFAQALHAVDYGAGAGFGQSNVPDVVLGPPRGSGTGAGGMHVLSLGRLGEIILDLGTCAVVDGPGVDLIVSENAFYIGGNPDAPYAELGAVAVSADGVAFTEFPCADDAYPYEGCAGWHPVLTHPDNAIDPFDPDAAGGDAFDLADIGIARARYVRIRDVSDAGFGGSAGFDLDAVTVVNGEIDE